MRIILQFPEGLKKEAIAEAGKLEGMGHEVFLSAAACFGACDLCLAEANAVGAKKIIHFGHAEFSKVKQGGVKVEYRPCFAEIPPDSRSATVRKALLLLSEAKLRKVALVFPIQHLKNADAAKKILEREGVQVMVGMGGAHVRYAGQVLGCDFGAAAVSGVDAVLYFGGGRFHPLGLPGGIPVLCADPHVGDAYWLTEEIRKAERRRAGSMLAATKAKTFGILVSTKCGQLNLAGARMAKKMLEKRGRKAAILVANELAPLALANFMSFDAYLNTACPRINDDSEAYGKPVVNVADLKRLLELMV